VVLGWCFKENKTVQIDQFHRYVSKQELEKMRDVFFELANHTTIFTI